MAAAGSRTGKTTARGYNCRHGHDEWRVSRLGASVCAVCDRQKARLHQSKRRELLPVETMWKNTKHRARNKGTPFTITPADVAAAFPLDNLCPVLKIPLSRGKGFLHDHSPTLDRINNDWGYEPGNIVVMSHRANRTKGNMRASELETIAAWMRHNGLD